MCQLRQHRNTRLRSIHTSSTPSSYHVLSVPSLSPVTASSSSSSSSWMIDESSSLRSTSPSFSSYSLYLVPIISSGFPHVFTLLSVVFCLCALIILTNAVCIGLATRKQNIHDEAEADDRCSISCTVWVLPFVISLSAAVFSRSVCIAKVVRDDSISFYYFLFPRTRKSIVLSSSSVLGRGWWNYSGELCFCLNFEWGQKFCFFFNMKQTKNIWLQFRKGWRKIGVEYLTIYFLNYVNF